VQGVLTDALSKRIIAEYVAPRFRAGDFHGGINSGVEAILKAVEGEALPPPARSPASGSGGSYAFSVESFFWAALFAVPIVATLLRSLLGRLLGAGLTSGITGAAAWWIFGSLVAAWVVALIAFVFALFLGTGALRHGRGISRGGGSWSGGGWSGGGGGSWGGGGGGGFSGGGGSFDGGGASGGW
jgi:uncharacterized protein